MVAERVNRKLAAILAADVVGYSRRIAMRRDDAGYALIYVLTL